MSLPDLYILIACAGGISICVSAGYRNAKAWRAYNALPAKTRRYRVMM